MIASLAYHYIISGERRQVVKLREALLVDPVLLRGTTNSARARHNYPIRRVHHPKLNLSTARYETFGVVTLPELEFEVYVVIFVAFNVLPIAIQSDVAESSKIPTLA